MDITLEGLSMPPTTISDPLGVVVALPIPSLTSNGDNGVIRRNHLFLESDETRLSGETLWFSAE